ncbi:MAG: hypothetical protein MI725_06070 [Pirellulales bacterium]|nr:hypothetical protein [Pirellulales bacterium]
MRKTCPQTKNILFFLITVVIGHYGISITIYAQQTSSEHGVDNIPNDVRDQLVKNASAMSSVHIVYSKSQQGEVASNYGGPSKYSAYFDTGFFYQNRTMLQRKKSGDIRSDVHEDAFDGNIFYFGSPGATKEAIPSLVKYSIEDETDPHRTNLLIDIPYLSAAGIKFPQNISELSKFSIESLVLHNISESTNTGVEQIGERLRVSVRIPDPILNSARHIDLSAERKLLESGRNSAEHVEREINAIRKMQEMEPYRIRRFLLDPNYGYGIVEREDRTASGELIVRVVSDDWKYYEKANIWLPGKCIESYYTYPSAPVEFNNKPKVKFTLLLDKADFNYQENVSFALDYKKPGTEIRDRSSTAAKESPDHEVSLIVSADGSTLRQSAEEALSENNESCSWVWIWINIVVVAILLIVVILRRVS